MSQPGFSEISINDTDSSGGLECPSCKAYRTDLKLIYTYVYLLTLNIEAPTLYLVLVTIYWLYSLSLLYMHSHYTLNKYSDHVAFCHDTTLRTSGTVTSPTFVPKVQPHHIDVAGVYVQYTPSCNPVTGGLHLGRTGPSICKETCVSRGNGETNTVPTVRTWTCQ